MSNRLASETSPYLLQHAQNPVDWYPWGAEAFERAVRDDKPILLSIGYAACHWCHVMEHESFENPQIAALMNEHFVSIKVDREERPDIDAIYMAATVALSGSGGWPMTVFLTHDKQPFFAGTYFPPTDKYGRPGFPTLLARIAELWGSQREELAAQAAELSEHVRDQSRVAEPLAVERAAIARAVAQLGSSFDARFGGFGTAPKFPPCGSLSLLLRHHQRTGDPVSLKMVETTLDAMKNGGMYDHLAGGFARYSTDERWLVPHFEKMLYDNAQLACAYLDAFQVTRNAEYARVARETLDYVIREMLGESGYFSATDADSEGVEGKFFVWSYDEVIELLGPETGERFALYYDVSQHGNWEETNILNTPRPLARVAEELGVSAAALEQELAGAKAKLYAARAQRVPPLLDDKVLTSWNGLMLSAMAAGACVLGERAYLDSALSVAERLLAVMTRPDGGLFHTARNGRAHVPGFLEDYAFLAEGLLALYEAGGPARWLREAERLTARMLADFADPDSGAFFDTAHDAEALIVRPREGHDNALPSANGVAARLLARLAHQLGRADYRERAEQAVAAYGKLIARAPRAFASTLSAVDLLSEPPLELTLVGTPGESSYEELRAALFARYLPNRVLAHLDPSAPASDDDELPLVRGKRSIPSKAALFVCRASVCDAPVTSVDALNESLARHTKR